MNFFKLLPDAKFHTSFSFYNCKQSVQYFPENPLHTKIDMNIGLSEETKHYTVRNGGNAKYPDLISGTDVNDFIINERTRDLLLQFKLTPHQYLPLQFFYKKELKNYWWLIFDKNFILHNKTMKKPLGIEFNGSLFETNERNSRIIDNKEDFYRIKDVFEIWASKYINEQSIEKKKALESTEPTNSLMRPTKLLINSELWQYDCFALPMEISPYNHYFINEKLKKQLEKTKIKGLRMNPVPWLVAV